MCEEKKTEKNDCETTELFFGEKAKEKAALRKVSLDLVQASIQRLGKTHRDRQQGKTRVNTGSVFTAI